MSNIINTYNIGSAKFSISLFFCLEHERNFVFVSVVSFFFVCLRIDLLELSFLNKDVRGSALGQEKTTQSIEVGY